jgi:hypothetical protein
VAAFIARNQLATIRCICGRGGDLVLARTLYARTPCVPRYMGEWARVGLLLMLGRRTALRGRR